MNEADWNFQNVPWLSGGRSMEGADCVGIVRLFLENESGLAPETPDSGEYATVQKEILNGKFLDTRTVWDRGDVLFFKRAGELVHVGVWLGEGKFLHSITGGARIDNGLTLVLRLGAEFAGVIGLNEIGKLKSALRVPTLGGPFMVIAVALVVTIGMGVYGMANKPKMPNFSNEFGRYSANGGFPLQTLVTTESPLPDVLGQLHLAGNAVYQTPVDKTQSITDLTQQKINRIVIFSGGPVIGFSQLKVNGLASHSRAYSGDPTVLGGFQANPATVDEAVNGIFSGASGLWSSFHAYLGSHGISVPVDIRASYDRDFPVYGFAGSSYIVFRFIDATKFQSGLNVSVQTVGHSVRKFNSSGFITASVVNESLAGANGTLVRFKLAQSDIKTVTAVTVNGIGHSALSASNQVGNIYHLNKTKGFVEFLTAPAAGATILVSYTYYDRSQSSKPAEQIAYLLTELWRGKGIDESKIYWPSFVETRDYSATTLTWNTGSRGPVTTERYLSNYVLDVRKPLGDHIRSLLDACHAQLFLSGGKFVLKARKAGTSVFSFNTTNILVQKDQGGLEKSTFISQMIDRSERSNRVHVLFRSAQTFNAQTGVVRDDPTNQAERAEDWQ